jgi:1-phosphofructokinase
MIVTVTLNPSLDRTVEVDRLERGGVLRTSAPTVEPGGKGVNVSRALTLNATPSVAIVPLGGAEGDELASLLAQTDVDARTVIVGGRTRSNLTVCEPDGTITKFNEPGSTLSAADLGALTSVIRDTVEVKDWVVISGSMTPGFSADELTDLIGTIAELGAFLAVDTSGQPLATAVELHPRLIKPNRAELAELVDRPLDSIADIIQAAEEVQAKGIATVLVSLGADGAVLVTEAGALVGESTVAVPRSTVGAGDSFLAGFLSRIARDENDTESALIEALAWGAAAASLPGSAVPGPGDITYENVQLVWQPDVDRPLLAS